MSDLTIIHGSKRITKQVPPSTRISALRALISRTLGISVRRRRIRVREPGDTDGRVVEEGDGGREIGWFVCGRVAEVVVE